MSKTLQLKRGNTSISNSYTGSPGEVTVDTTNWDLRVHDGVTAGGWVVDSSNSGGSFGDERLLPVGYWISKFNPKSWKAFNKNKDLILEW